MPLVYTHENLFLVNNAQALLRSENIDAEIKNEYAGGGRGELPVFETWPELWVVNEQDAQRARAILEQRLQQAPATEWQCEECGEINASSFETCWRCQQPHDAPGLEK